MGIIRRFDPNQAYIGLNGIRIHVNRPKLPELLKLLVKLKLRPHPMLHEEKYFGKEQTSAMASSSDRGGKRLNACGNDKSKKEPIHPSEE
ncbi:unnamed protein product [Cylindrotheca closterium]|uniref:Uncharacterized protein n=1 Tax=Cylindrotheca closterium TaxID=2856 RepID=A0AAD2FDF1_9STRA|nr:unnamed protein product [Cylindrotheca closterium]